MTESIVYPVEWFAKRAKLIATCEYGHREVIGCVERQDDSPPNIYDTVAEIAQHYAEELGGCLTHSWHIISGAWQPTGHRYAEPPCRGYIRVSWEACGADGDLIQPNFPADATMRDPKLDPEGWFIEGGCCG